MGTSASGNAGLSGARDDFAARFEASSKTLWCVAAACLHDRSEAQDVVQEAAVIAIEKLRGGTENPTHFVAWMAQIVRHVAANANRKKTRRRTSPSDPGVIDTSRESREAAPGTHAGSAAAWGRGVDRTGAVVKGAEVFDDVMVGALEELEETARACLLLKVVMEMSYRDVAETLGIPEGTAMSHVHRARKAMAAKLTAKGYGPAGPKGGGR